MELSKRSRITLGIATLLEVVFPLLIGLLYMLMFFLMPVMMATNPTSEDSIFAVFFLGFLFFGFLMIFFSIFQIIMKILYLILVIKNEEATDLIKILFVLGTFYVPLIAMPLYYVIYFLKEKNEVEGTLKVEEPVSPA